MVITPLRRAPMMLGGVGFQAGLDEAARRKQIEAQRQAAPAPAPPDVIGQLTELKRLLDSGVVTPEEFQLAKRKVLG